MFLACAYVMGVDVHWTGKQSLFPPLFGWFLRWIGGVPVSRDSSRDAVQQMIGEFGRRTHFVLAIQPEGTRKKGTAWRTGFYYIALGAGVPVALTFLDYARKVGGFGPCFVPSGDIQADAAIIRQFYADKKGKFPDSFTPVVFPERNPTQPAPRSATRS
jgi:1-acyl-sn-glycerol-3-phosphate acyltransferase